MNKQIPCPGTYQLYDQGDKSIHSFEAEGYYRDLFFEGTVSPYGVSARDETEIDKHAKAIVEAPDGQKGPVAKINPS
jgi:hypothetical protein